jgi:hypothetical protein
MGLLHRDRAIGTWTHAVGIVTMVASLALAARHVRDPE